MPKHQEIFISPHAESLFDAMNISHESIEIKITENDWWKCKSWWERQQQYVSKDSKNMEKIRHSVSVNMKTNYKNGIMNVNAKQMA
jgi:hypothetical protein